MKFMGKQNVFYNRLTQIVDNTRETIKKTPFGVLLSLKVRH